MRYGVNEEALIRRVRRYLESSGINAETPVLVACSGGVDSIVLLDSVVAAGFQRVYTAYIDHGIRPAAETGRDRGVVADLADKRSVPFLYRTIPAGMIREIARTENGSEEAIAREHRYRLLLEIAGEIGAETAGGVPAVLVAHHRDDQAETVLMRMLSGRSPFEHTGIPREREVGDTVILRPLLDTPRSAIEAYAAVRCLSWSSDITNDEPGYLRNHIRTAVLPLIAERYPSVGETVARYGDEVERMRHALNLLVPDGAWGRSWNDGSWSFRLDEITRLPGALQEIVLRRAVQNVSLSDRISVRPIINAWRKWTEGGDIDGLADGTSHTIFRSQEIELFSGAGSLVVRASIVRSIESGYLLEVPDGCCVVFDRLVSRIDDHSTDDLHPRRYFAPVAPPVVVRGRRPGDRIVRDGVSKNWSEFFLAGDGDSAQDVHTIEDAIGTVAIVAIGGKFVVRDGVSVVDTAPPDKHAVCTQFQD